MYRVKLFIVIAAAAVLAAYSSSRAATGDTNTPALTQNAGSWGLITFWSGAKIQDPYTIVESGHAATLTKSQTTTDGYIELNLNTRYVLRSGKFDQLPVALSILPSAFPTTPPSPPPPPGLIHLVAFWREMPDIDAKIGYIFRGSSSPTNLSLSTIVGGADIYSDVSIGLPLLRYENTDSQSNLIKQQVSLELSGGFATDKDFVAIHPNLFLGAGWQGRFPAPNLTPQSLPAILTGRVGFARIDEPRLISGSTVALDNFNNPEFDSIWTPSVGVQLIYPINSSVNLQAGGNVYFTSTPASWNLNLGLTLDLAKFFSAFSK